MANILINVEDNVLSEAENALVSIGMDIQIAVNVFLRRVAIEKGFPLSMTAVPIEKETTANHNDKKDKKMYHTRNNNTINKDMIYDVWNAFVKYYKGLDVISHLRDEISENSGMNRGSAFIYLTILANLIKGVPNTRTMKMSDLEFYMNKIQVELGCDEYRKAIQSLQSSIPYWETKLSGSFAKQVKEKLESDWVI